MPKTATTKPKPGVNAPPVTCRHCTFWVPTENAKIGECRKHYPMFIDHEGMASFPKTLQTTSCASAVLATIYAFRFATANDDELQAKAANDEVEAILRGDNRLDEDEDYEQ